MKKYLILVSLIAIAFLVGCTTTNSECPVIEENICPEQIVCDEYVETICPTCVETVCAEEVLIVNDNPISLSGSGDEVLTGISISEGMRIITGTHNGQHNFIVETYDSYGDWNLLFNKIGRYDGEIAEFITYTDDYVFEITADGDWTIKIE